MSGFGDDLKLMLDVLSARGAADDRIHLVLPARCTVSGLERDCFRLLTANRLMVAGLLAWGLLHIQNGAIYSWQALFLIVGGESQGSDRH